MKKLYLIPGLMTDIRLWSKITPLLKDSFELIHLPIPLTNTLDEACKVLEKTFKDEKKVNLLGFSFGSYIASYFTIQNQEKIDKLFLLSGSASFINTLEIEKRKIVLKQMEKFGFKGLSDKKTISLIEESSKDDKKLIELIKDMYKDLGYEVYKKQMELSFKRYDISDKLIGLDMPIKLYFSSEDRLFDYNALKKLKTANKENIKFKQRIGCSHMIPLEDPKGLSKEIKDWFDK